MDGAPLEKFEDESWGDQPFGAPMPRAFRLSDAERIAAQRLDGAAEGSLKEALATVVVDLDSEPASLAERLQKIAAASDASPAGAPPHEPPPVVSMMPAEPDFGWFGAVPPAHAVPCFEDRDFEALTAEAFTPASLPASVSTPAAAVDAAPASAEAHGPAPSEAHAPSEPEAAPAFVALQEDAAADAAQVATPAEAEPAPLALPEDPNLEPIVTAYAASARLAADAAAASQALFELQKLLNQQMLEASPELNDAMEAHGFARLDAIPVAQQAAPVVVAPAATVERAPDPATDASLAPPRMVQHASQRLASVPPPLPQPPPLAAPRRPAPVHASRAVAPSKTGPAPRRVKPAPAAQARRRENTFDVRGFAAGFALSGAIGVVLYFVVATS